MLDSMKLASLGDDDQDGSSEFCNVCKKNRYLHNSDLRLVCVEPGCSNVMCMSCEYQKRCKSCKFQFLPFCASHYHRGKGEQNCNNCLGVFKFSALSLDDVDDEKIIEDMKQQTHQRVSLGELLPQKSFTEKTRKVISFNINGKSIVGNARRRKIIGEAFLAACQADIILLQDSSWKQSKILDHFNENHNVRQYLPVGTRCAAIAYDEKSFKMHAHADRGFDYTAFAPPAAYANMCFHNSGHNTAANKNAVLANIYYLLERATIIVLEEVDSENSIIVVASYHGPWKGVSATEAVGICKWLVSLIGWYASIYKCEYLLGGDFNIDITDCVDVMPTHNHDPRRTNHLDWIVPSCFGILHGGVNYSSLFPLPPHNSAVGADCCLLEPNDNHSLDDDIYWPWDEDRWLLLAQIIKREKTTVLWIAEDPESVFDHSPMHAFFSLKRR